MMADGENTDTIPLVESNCYLCASPERKAWGSEHGYTCFKCLECGLVYVSPRPAPAAIQEANKLGQHRTESGAINVIGRRSSRKVERYRRIFRDLFADVAAAGRPVSWLDVGAGFGEAVEALRDVLPKGSRIEGIEPMTAKVVVANQRGLPISDRPLESLTGSYDYVSIINVFSHVPEFDSFLARLSALLTPNGRLFLETANGGELESAAEYPDALFLPDHLMFGGQQTLEAFLSRAGFVVEQWRRERRDTMLWSLKSAAKLMLGRQAKVTMPYASAYRILMLRARRDLQSAEAKAAA